MPAAMMTDRKQEGTPKGRSLARRGARALRILLCAALVPLLLPHARAAAQDFQLEIDYVDITQFPSIRIALHVTDAGGKRLDLSASNFHVRENGAEQTPLAVDCTQDSLRPPVSFMLGLDESVSMIYYPGSRQVDPDSSKMHAAKNVLSDFVRNLRGNDEAALIGFNEHVRLELAFTSDRQWLLDVISGLGVDFGTSLYDAIIEALQLVATRPYKKVIIIITDGTDTTSGSSFADAVNAAQQYQIPIYCIGVGADVDSLVLKEIARRTNGKFFFAPTADDLARMYDQISQGIFNGICTLSYVSSFPCADGGTRNLEISFTKDGQTVTKSVSYTAPYRPAYAALRIDTPAEVQDDVSFLASVRTDASPDTGNAITAEFDLAFDPALCLFDAALPDSTLLPGAIVDVRPAGPGLLHVSITNARLRDSTGTGLRDLLILRFRTLPQSRVIAASISLRNAVMKYPCEAVVATADAAFRIRGCPDRVRFALERVYLVAAGEDLLVPIRIVDSVDVGQAMGYRFGFRYDPALLEFIGIESEGTVTEPAALTAVDDPSAGKITLVAQDALPRARTGILAMLRFRTRMRLESTGTNLAVDSVAFHQSCSPATALDGALVLIEGQCERIAVTAGSVLLRQNRPNPANPSALIDFTVRGGNHVTLTLFDIMGRPVRTLVDGRLAAGSHRVSVDAGDLPSGVYFYTLRDGGVTMTRKMIVQR